MAAGDREVCKRFDRPLKRGAAFSTELSYELVGSFDTEREGIIHVVEGRTRRVKLTVLFPAGKRIYEQRALLRYGGEERSELENKPGRSRLCCASLLFLPDSVTGAGCQ